MNTFVCPSVSLHFIQAPPGRDCILFVTLAACHNLLRCYPPSYFIHGETEVQRGESGSTESQQAGAGAQVGLTWQPLLLPHLLVAWRQPEELRASEEVAGERRGGSQDEGMAAGP